MCQNVQTITRVRAPPLWPSTITAISKPQHLPQSANAIWFRSAFASHTISPCASDVSVLNYHSRRFSLFYFLQWTEMKRAFPPFPKACSHHPDALIIRRELGVFVATVSVFLRCLHSTILQLKPSSVDLFLPFFHSFFWKSYRLIFFCFYYFWCL